jgi:acyl-CoA synthetase (AMP-forming)/AMP-acid ligase II
MKRVLLLSRPHSLGLSAKRRLSANSYSSQQVIMRSPINMPELSSDLVKKSLPVFLLKDFLSNDKKDLEAIVDGSTGASVTYSDVFYNSCSLADSLNRLGVGKGDRVAIISPNHVHYLSAFLAVSLNEAISTCMNPLCSEPEISYQLEKTKAKLVLVHPMCVETVLKLVPKERIVLMDPPAGTPSTSIDTKHDGLLRLSYLMGNTPHAETLCRLEPPRDFDPHSLVTIPFSSGTTGRSKGVMLTHHNLTSNILQTMPFESQYLRATTNQPRGTLLCPLPFFHIYGLTAGLLCCSYAGAKMVFMSTFDLKNYLELIVAHKVTRSFVVPPIVLALAKHPMVAQYDLSSLQSLMSGAAPLGQDIQVACAKRLNCLVKQGWGMTETSPCGTITPDHMVTTVEALQGTSGQLAPGTEGKIVDPLTGVDLPFTATGELLVRGPQIMKGYLDDLAATQACLTEDGWLHTGDIAHFDTNGWLYITDRMKELIKYKGMQVPPAELEAVIASMTAVKDVIVIPVLDEEAGELPRAYVVPQEGAQLTPEQIMSYVAERVAPYKRLRGGVRFVEAVPKSPSGKLLRRLMIEQDRKQSYGQVLLD